MAYLAEQIIRQQWKDRRHPNPIRRLEAQTLIRTHVIMLRQWRETELTAASGKILAMV